MLVGGFVQSRCADADRQGGLRARLSPRLAVGDLTGLPAPTRRAFTAGHHFRSLDRAQEGRWLREEGTSGQSVGEFLMAGGPRPAPGRRTLVLRPLSGVRDQRSPDLEVLRSYAEAFFQIPVTIRRGPDRLDPDITVRRHPISGEPQLHARRLLEVLRRELKPDDFAAMGVTGTDLYPGEDWSHVYGLASLRHRVGVLSYARFVPRDAAHSWTDRQRQGLKWRSLNVLTHETGHIFGLRHCVYYQCNMNGSYTFSANDRSPLRLCPVCLRKLQFALGFDVQVRYRALKRFYRRHGLWRNERWVERRLAYIRGGQRYRRAQSPGLLPAGGAPRADLH